VKEISNKCFLLIISDTDKIFKIRSYYQNCVTILREKKHQFSKKKEKNNMIHNNFKIKINVKIRMVIYTLKPH